MSDQHEMIDLPIDEELWNRVFTVHGLFLVGSKENNGKFNLAPKHMGMPMGFSPFFGFIGTSRKTTYQNINREGVFTVSYPNPDQIITASLSASQREPDHSKPIIEQLDTVPAQKIEGILLTDSYLQLECELHEITGSYGEWQMIIGRVIAAHVQRSCIRNTSVDDNDLLFEHPLLAYVHPDRHTQINETRKLPLPQHFKR